MGITFLASWKTSAWFVYKLGVSVKPHFDCFSIHIAQRLPIVLGPVAYLSVLWNKLNLISNEYLQKSIKFIYRYELHGISLCYSTDNT